jgi:hypothetical protein
MESGSNRYRDLFNSTIGETPGYALNILSSYPALLIPGTVLLRHRRRAAAVRKRHERELHRLRETPEVLTESGGGCAVRAEEEIVSRR